MNVLDKYQTFYFAGIGGIGMSNLARYFHASGKNVLGYDKTETKLTKELVAEGISITFEDDIHKNIADLNPDNTLVVYTPAIKNLKILDYFNENNFQILKRAKVLGLITEHTECIAVAGTHGKTTTSTLIAHLCNVAGLPFSCFLGGISENFKSNFLYKGNQYSVVEADEYDRSFLQLSPDWAIITSDDADHLDIYGDAETIRRGFQDFADLIPENRQLFVRKGTNLNRPCMTYAVNSPADFYSDDLRIEKGHMHFSFHHEGKTTPFCWEIPGIHNVENATAAIALLSSLGIDMSTLQQGISSFKGIKRRYTIHHFDDKIYIDDYAHHPTELDAVLNSIRTFYPEKKLLVVFQPHLFSRTRDFADGFAKSLSNSDELLLLDIYPARELQEDFQGITSEWLSEKIIHQNKNVTSLVNSLEMIKEKDFDIILTAGAGNIDRLYDPIVEWLSRK